MAAPKYQEFFRYFAAAIAANTIFMVLKTIKAYEKTDAIAAFLRYVVKLLSNLERSYNQLDPILEHGHHPSQSMVVTRMANLHVYSIKSGSQGA